MARKLIVSLYFRALINNEQTTIHSAFTQLPLRLDERAQ